jgi:class 3 adenylate cyclase/predicted ATPase
MFCDLVGSTALSERLDPEDYHEVLRAYQTTCSEVIRDFGGYIAQYLGDGLLVYFGYPLAHEDDAKRAAKAALGILTALDQLNVNLEQNLNLAVRVGVHTGMVVVGALGTESDGDQLALGETLNIAARLLTIAEPNTIVVTAATYQLIQGSFQCQSLGAHALKGISKPVPLYEILKETDNRESLKILPGTLTPLVNRTQELQQLQHRWLKVKQGEGQVVLIDGEPGIGKTRLVMAMQDWLQEEAHTRLICRCYSYYSHSALHPVIELLQKKLDHGGEISHQNRLAQLEQNLAPYAVSLQELAPLLMPLLSTSFTYRHTPFTQAAEQQRQKTLQALETLVFALALYRPLLLVVENLHWVDPSTLELLGRLIKGAKTRRMLIIVTYRPGFSIPWAAAPQFGRLSLTRLSQTGVASIAKHVAGKQTLPDEWLDYIVTKTDGIPLFAEELTKTLTEVGLDGALQNVQQGSVSQAQRAIPVTLRDSLMARLDRLTTAKNVAQLGAVLGREFSYEMLRAICSLDETTLKQELARLTDAELLYPQNDPPRTRFVFKHALIQDAAYESLLKRQRKLYHQRIAKALEEQFQETSATHPELVAHHYTEAGSSEKAIVYWQKASQKAISRSAYKEAIAHLNKALALFETLPETRPYIQRELELRTSLGTALIATKGFADPVVEKTYRRALELCKGTQQSFALYQILLGLSRFYFIRGELNTARDMGERLLALAKDLDDPTLPLMEGHRALGSTLLQRGEFVQAKAHLEKAIALYGASKQHAPRSLFWADPGVVCLSFAAETLWSLGYPQQALAKSQQAITQAHALAHPFSLTHALALSAWLRRQRGELAESKKGAEQVIALASEHDFLFYLATGTVLKGWAMVEEGEGEQGMAQIREGLQAYQAMGAKLILASGCYMLADAYQKIGCVQEGVESLAQALALVQQHGEHFWEAELHRLKGDLLLRQSTSQQAQAEACFKKAIDLARRQQAKSLELRATKGLARLWQQQGNRKQAYGILKTLYDWFQEGLDTADLRETKILLEALKHE